MFDSQAVLQEVESARAILMIIGVIIVVFWKTILRILIAIFVIVIVVTVGYGSLALMAAMRR